MSSSRTSSGEKKKSSSSTTPSDEHKQKPSDVPNAFRGPLVTLPPFKQVTFLENERWKLQSHTDFSRLLVRHANFVCTESAQPPYDFSFEPIRHGQSLESCLKYLSSIRNDVYFDQYRNQLCKSVLLQLVMAVFYLEHIIGESSTQFSATPHRDICPKTIVFLDGCLKLSTPNCIPPPNANANYDMYINSYVAPEIIAQKNRLARTSGGFVSDMFSIGVVAYSIMKCQCLLPDDANFNANSSQFNSFNDLDRNGNEWLAVFPDNTIRDLVGRLLTKNPARRINSLDALVFILRDPADTWSVRHGLRCLQDRVFNNDIVRQFVTVLRKMVFRGLNLQYVLVRHTSDVRELRRSFFRDGEHDKVIELEDDFGQFVNSIESSAWSACGTFLAQVKLYLMNK